jgi:hypothetical protein
VAAVIDKTYRVVITHENSAWLADVPDLAGTHTFARNIPSLQKAVRELIALVEDLPDGAEDDLDVDYEYRIGIPEVEAETRQLRADRERIRREENELARRTDAAAKTLVERYKFSVRDAAALTGVSKQRISQLAPTKDAAKLAARQVPPAREEETSQAARATRSAAGRSTAAAATSRKATPSARSSSKTSGLARNGSTGRHVTKPAKAKRTRGSGEGTSAEGEAS